MNDHDKSINELLANLNNEIDKTQKEFNRINGLKHSDKIYELQVVS
jgi:hypothetical protein